MVPEIVTDIESLDDLREEWNELLHSSSANNLFLTWEWISSWCTHMLRSSETPIIITAREGKYLVGIAPLLRDRHRFLGDYYHIIGQQYSYHLGFISEKGKEPQVYSEIWDHIFKIAGKRFSEIGFINLRDDLLMDSTLRRRAAALGYKAEKKIQNPCAVLILPDSFEAYLRKGIASERLGKNLRGNLNRLTKENLFSYYESGKNDFEFIWSEMLNLHSINMKFQNRHSIMQSRAFPEHLKNIAGLNMESSSTKLGILKVENKTAAILLGILYSGCFYALTIGVNPEMRKKYKWLNLCVVSNSFSIRSAIENKCSVFDFLGGKEEFKFKMGGREKDGIIIAIFRSNFHKFLIRSVNWFYSFLKNNFVLP